MSIELRNKLIQAKKNKELKIIINLIISKTHLQEKDITCSDITYQKVIDISYDKLKLKKNCYDIESERNSFNAFFAESSNEDNIAFMTKTNDNIFFLSLPYSSVKENLDFFWNENKIKNHRNEKIFVNHDLSKGFIILLSEYGIETASW